MGLHKKHCVPCEGGVEPLEAREEETLLSAIPGWSIERTGIHKIVRTFDLRSFREALRFVVRIGRIAEAEGHHPDIHISYRRVTLELYTHAVVGLTENDFIFAAKADRATPICGIGG